MMDFDEVSSSDDENQLGNVDKKAQRTKVSLIRKPKTDLESRYDEATNYFKSDPDMIKAMEAFCDLASRLKAADHAGKVAILFEINGLKNVL